MCVQTLFLHMLGVLGRLTGRGVLRMWSHPHGQHHRCEILQRQDTLFRQLDDSLRHKNERHVADNKWEHLNQRCPRHNSKDKLAQAAQNLREAVRRQERSNGMEIFHNFNDIRLT